ncbi:hypothetical protein [Bacteroides sp. 51]|uniref:hypothetical protein n=1 Tax=Bacteroides sp. 51 TaxID=2302938 RepID=UPI0013D65B38|nr:hypothetical protein [Bacteroides sp. 51]NDV82101.1 hypothetical protein [Bacteroides sp. 51]
MKKQETTKNTTIAMFLPVIVALIVTTLNGEDLQSPSYWVKTVFIFILLFTSAYFIYRELKAKASKTEETTNSGDSSKSAPTNVGKSTIEPKFFLSIVAAILIFVLASAYYVVHFLD